MMASPDTHFSMQSSSNINGGGGGAFGASRGSSGNMRIPFGQTSQLAFNVQNAAGKALANLGPKSGQAAVGVGGGGAAEGKQLLFGFNRANSRGASNGRDRYRNMSNAENFDDASIKDSDSQ